jgi:adenine-specific DNA-methyltransferase
VENIDTQRVGYSVGRHSAVRTSEYIFHQLIPYIGNKRKLLDLIHRAVRLTGVHEGLFVDFFAGSGVVSRYAKKQGFTVYANDWEPYSEAINGCYIDCNEPPAFSEFGGYESAIDLLNSLPGKEDWVTRFLSPDDDDNFDTAKERMFYMRKNGLRIDAIREAIEKWWYEGKLSVAERNCLIGPLLYQCCYTSNTSGVFKGFHRGWGGATKTALYRIMSDLSLSPAVFHNNGMENQVFRMDANQLAMQLSERKIDIAYLDPPYNQHPYGSNYHVLNSVSLWDKPPLTKHIEGRNKAAIRLDWRSQRRSKFNHSKQAAAEYRRLVSKINARYILTSYSTDGNIPLESLVESNLERGCVDVVMKSYKRYRVSSQRFSKKPVNIEFILVLDTSAPCRQNVIDICDAIRRTEQEVISGHPESQVPDSSQASLFEN